MASTAGAIRAGRAFVEIFADDSRLRRTLDRSAKRLTSFGRTTAMIGAGIAAAGAAVAGPMLAMARGFAAWGDEIAKASARTGIAVESMSLLKFAAEQSGATLQQVEKSAQRMSRTISDAGAGLSTATRALDQLNLSSEELLALSPEEQFLTVADRLAAIENPTIRAATAMEVFGRSGTNLLPMLANGAAGIEKLMQKGRDLGVELSGPDAAAAVELTDAWHSLTEAWKAAKNMIGAALAPTLTELSAKAAAYVKVIRDWLDQNRTLALTLFKVAAGVVAVGTGIVMLGGLLATAGLALAGLSAGLGAVGALFSTLLAVVGALLSPIGLVTAAVVGLGGYLLHTSGVGGKAIDWLAERFAWLKDVVGKTMGGVMDAIAAGDLGLAFEVAWAGVMVVWQTAAQKLKAGFADVKWYFLTVWDELTFGLVESWIRMSSTIQTVWLKAMNAIDGIAVKSVTWMAGMYEKAFDAIGLDDYSAAFKMARGVLQSKGQARSEGRADRMADIAGNREERLSTVQSMREEAARRRQREYAQQIQGAQEDLNSATRQWEEAVGRAADAREQVESAAAAPTLEERMSGLQPVMETAGGASAGGTFSAAAAMAMGRGGNPRKVEVDLLKQSVGNTSELVALFRKWSVGA